MRELSTNKYSVYGWSVKIVMAALLLTIMVLTMKPMQVQAAKVKINKTNTTLYVGNTATLKVSGTSKSVQWKTSKKAVATVSSKGKVTAKKSGTAIITAKVGKTTLKCKVTVKNPNSSKRLKLAKKEAKRIVKKYISSDMNTAERAYVLSRYLTENCSWQKDQSTAAYKKNYGNEAYAALVMKKAACSGYAKAYTMLCNLANVPVRHVNQNQWTHQWNEVKIGNKWIKVDTYGGTFASTKGIRKSILQRKTYNEEGKTEIPLFSFTIYY